MCAANADTVSFDGGLPRLKSMINDTNDHVSLTKASLHGLT